jgi:CheY-like chemotaxis protein
MNQLILVVEDDATMQKMALKILRSRGFSSELARSGREAVAMAAALKPALILMDLSLPEMNGWEATRALKADAALAHIPVVAITAHAMVGDRETAIAAGCAECLTKPYELDELIALVERYIGPAQAQPRTKVA